MSVVSLLGVKILNNPAPFLAPYQFEITFECLEQLQKGWFAVQIDPYSTTNGRRPRMENHLRGRREDVSTLRISRQQSRHKTEIRNTDTRRSEYDQELDSLLVGPIPVGINKFIFEADPPDLKRIPEPEILGVTVILLSCSYDGREFVRVGYYVNNEYDSEELANEPPTKPIIERIRRNILAEKPRVTRFAIKWYVFPICGCGCG